MSTAGTPVASDVKHPAPTTTVTNTATPTVVAEEVVTKRRIDPLLAETSLADVDYFFLVSESFREVVFYDSAQEIRVIR
jgi:hypothetical protein